MSSVLAPPTAAGGSSSADPPVQQPQEEITISVVSPAGPTASGPPPDPPLEEVAAAAVPVPVSSSSTAPSSSLPVLIVPEGSSTASLAKGIHMVIVVPSTDSPGTAAAGGLQALLVPAGFCSSRDVVDDAPSDPRQRNKSIRELRGWLLVLATLIASITYASGLSPPDGFQRDYQRRYSTLNGEPAWVVFEPVFRSLSPWRYDGFYYCNTAAFGLSLSIIVLLASQDLRELAKMKVLEIIVTLDLLMLLAAYITGSTFGMVQLLTCTVLVLIVPVALIVTSLGIWGKYFWNEL